MNFNPVTSDIPNPDRDNPASMRAVCFESAGSKLLGTLFLAEGIGPHKTLLLLHGFPGNETNFDIAHAARRAGWNVLVFHYRGSWGSQGSFSWSNAIQDTQCAVKFLKNELIIHEFNINKDQLVIIGHSMGGFLAMLTAIGDSSINHIGYLAGFNFGLFADVLQKNEIAKQITLESLEHSSKMLAGASPLELMAEMIKNSSDWNLLNHLDHLKKKNILMAGAKHDSISLYDIHHGPLAEALKDSNNGLLTEIIMDTGHSFSDKRISLTQTVIDWLNKIEV